MTGRRVRPTGDLFHRVVPEGAVYVGRPGRWGNPYPVHEYGLAESRRLFRAYLADRPHLVARAREELAGKDLACWCKPEVEWCHADDWLDLLACRGGDRA